MLGSIKCGALMGYFAGVMGTVEGKVRFLQLLSCWVRVKPWVFLAFGDWKPLALGELAGGFMLTPLVMRSHPPVKIWWD